MNGSRRRPPELLRPFTPTEQKIALGLLSGVDYVEIGKGIGDISARTVRAHVEAMAQKIIGLEVLEPRHAVVTYYLWVEWRDSMTQRQT